MMLWGQGKDKMTFQDDFHDCNSETITKEDSTFIIH